MIDFGRERRLTWIPRLGFGFLLLVFGEMVAWQHASSYGPLDWLAVGGIYLALATVLLDLIARWRVLGWPGLLLVGGVFGLTQSSLISLGLFDNLPISLVFYGTGLEVVMFMLAFGSFLMLYTVQRGSPRRLGLAALVGLGWGIWTRWYPEIDSVNLPVPTLDEALPATVIALLFSAIFMYIPPPPTQMTRQDWLLEPYEWAIAGGALGVCFVIRLSDGYFSGLGLSLAVILLGMILLTLWFFRAASTDSVLKHLSQPKQPFLLAWVFLLGVFMVSGWLGYRLPSNGDDPLQATILFGLLALFGVLWLPVVLVLVGMRAFGQLAREEY